MERGMKQLTYAMIIEPGRDRRGRRYYCAYFPDLPGCATMGSDRAHLMRMAREAVEIHLQVTQDFGEPVPLPSSEVATVTVAAPGGRRANPRGTAARRKPRPPAAKAGGTKHRAAKYAAAKNGAGRQLTVRQAGRGTKGKGKNGKAG
jgi:predicted RNase H-like HicB family nuclease